MQDLDLETTAKATGRGPRAAEVLQMWKARQKAFASPAGRGQLKPAATAWDRCRFSEEQGLPCVQAEQPLSVLGAVSEMFGDKLAAFLGEHGLKKDKQFKKAMQLRCAPVPLSLWTHTEGPTLLTPAARSPRPGDLYPRSHWRDGGVRTQASVYLN